ncbi:MAG: site-2 protease family protein [Clostridia bacterium]|nr:site-2 protease family protein [Clostridia bacterium]
MNFWHILAAIGIFGLLILIHELGHFIAARAFGVTVKEFSIGMGPKLFSITSKKSGIKYSLGILPIGGYVAMVGEDEESDDENAFHKKAVWKRMIITAAGAIVNIIAGILVMSILVGTEAKLPSNTIADFARDENGYSVSESAGVMAGDRVIKIDGVRVHVMNETYYEISMRGINPIDITVERNGEIVVIEDVTYATETESGVLLALPDLIPLAEDKTVGNVLKHAVYRSTLTIKSIWESVFNLITGRFTTEAIAGPIGTTKLLGEAASQSFSDFVYLSVIISMNLGVMNLLPLPALDGGRLVFQAIELVTRKRIKPEIEGYIHFAGIVLLMILMVMITVKDVISLF